MSTSLSLPCLTIRWMFSFSQLDLWQRRCQKKLVSGLFLRQTFQECSCSHHELRACCAYLRSPTYVSEFCVRTYPNFDAAFFNNLLTPRLHLHKIGLQLQFHFASFGADVI